MKTAQKYTVTGRQLLKACIMLILPIFLSGTAFGQSTDAELWMRYEKALLDSLSRYEILKLTYHEQKRTIQFQASQIAALHEENRLQRMQGQEQVQSMQAEIRKTRRGATIGAVIFGAGLFLLLR